MPLPDLSRLAALPPTTLRALGVRLATLGLTLPRVAPVVAAVAPLAPPLRAPIRRFHLRRIDDPVGYAMRMLLFADPVTPAQARAVLGDLLDPLLEAGLIEQRDGGALVSPFLLSVVDDLYILSDDLAHGGDAVMGLGQTTAMLCSAAAPAPAGGRALDMGCGAGTCALVLSRTARHVVATDINPRAVALTRINAAINGVTNVDCRQGDLFAPVAAETFDLVVSQPPFVPRPQGLGATTLLDGGARGDEIALRLLSELAPRLAPGGRAVLAIEWPVTGGAPVEARIREALGSDEVNTLVLRCPAMGPDEHAASYAAGAHPVLDDAFERDALLRREHLDRLGINGLELTFTIIERAARLPGFTHTVAIAPATKVDLTRARIDKLLAGRALMGDSDRLLAAKLRVPEGTIFAQEQEGPGAEQPSTLTARYAEAALIEPVGLSTHLLFLMTFLHEAPDVRAGIARFAEELGMNADDAMKQALPGIEQALVAGLLEVA